MPSSKCGFSTRLHCEGDSKLDIGEGSLPGQTTVVSEMRPGSRSQFRIGGAQPITCTSAKLRTSELLCCILTYLPITAGL